MPVAPTRRNLLLASLAAAIAATGAVGFPVALFADGEVTVDQFLTLSKSLTGAADLDAAVGKTLLGGFLAIGKGPGLAALVAGKDGPDTKGLAEAIVAAWYSGVYDTGKGQAVATFTDALVWTALTYTKPFAYCGGVTGYWSDPPET